MVVQSEGDSTPKGRWRMTLEVVAGPGTETMQQEVVEAVKSVLGVRAEAGPWLLSVHRRDRGYLVDLTNRDGIMRQWFFEAGDPVAALIRQGLDSSG
jgi:hypothetical protein